MRLWFRHSTRHQKQSGERKKIHTKHICCHYYTNRNLAKVKNVEEREEIRGRPLHPICKDCLCNGVPVVCTNRGRKNKLNKSIGKRKQKKADRVAYLGQKQMKPAEHF